MCKKNASSGNRTRAARVAGEHSTTEPTMLLVLGLMIGKSDSHVPFAGALKLCSKVIDKMNLVTSFYKCLLLDTVPSIVFFPIG